MIDFSLIYRVKRLFSLIGIPLFWILIHVVSFFVLMWELIQVQLQTFHQKQIIFFKLEQKKLSQVFFYSKNQTEDWIWRLRYAPKQRFKKSPPKKFKPSKQKPSLSTFSSLISGLRFLFSSHRKTVTVYHRERTVQTVVPKDISIVTSPVLPKRKIKLAWIIGGFATFVLLLGSGSGFLFYQLILKDLPTPEDLRHFESNLTTKIYDRNRVLLYKIYKDENRTLVHLRDLPQHTIDATIAIEDKEFYAHHGISFRGLGRAFRSLFEYGKIQGGSTITQQLIKNTLLSSERTLARKLKEIVIAVQVERAFSKDEILEMYLNEVAYGGSVYGIEEASRVHFNKSAKELTVAESAFLAGLPAAPSVYSPFGSYPEQGIYRQYEVLRRMVEDGKVSPIQAEQAKAEELVFANASTNIKAPHFVMYVKEILAKRFGEDVVSQGGLEVVTTLDFSLQEQAQKIVKDEIEKLKKLRVGNGAALITNPKSGEILAMVGSTNYFDTKNDGQVNVTIRPRQPGSSIKPLTYAIAFERGMTPTTTILDAPITYSIAGSPPYSPKNYDGRYHGNVTIRQALANSYNIPAVKTLASIGVSSMVERGRTLGITTWDTPSRYGLSLTLGGGEVLMTDMAVMYSTFANAGQSVPLNPFIEVKSQTGEVLYENQCISSPTPCGGRRTLDPRIAYQITNILTDNKARSQAFGSNSVLHIPGHEVSVKTGTTNGLKDNWTFGYTSDRLVSVWVGNNDNTPMSRVTSGITGASPIWNKLIQTQLHPNSPHVFAIPSNLQAVTVCGAHGQIRYTEYFFSGTEPQTNCTPTKEEATPEQVSERTFNTRDRIIDGVAIQ